MQKFDPSSRSLKHIERFFAMMNVSLATVCEEVAENIEDRQTGG
jgi:hypothetical protein